MFASAGYFRGVNCPYHVSGCERPYCHFKHAKVKERNDTVKSRVSSSTSSASQDSLSATTRDVPDTSLSKSTAESEAPPVIVAKSLQPPRMTLSGDADQSAVIGKPSSTLASDKPQKAPGTAPVSSILTLNSDNLANIVVPLLDIVVNEDELRAAVAAATAASPGPDAPRGSDGVTAAIATDGEDHKVPHYSPASSPADEASFSPPASPSPPVEDFEDEEDAALAPPRAMLSYQSRPEDFDPLDAENATPFSKDNIDASTDTVESAIEDTHTADVDDFGYPESKKALDLQELLNAYNAPQTGGDTLSSSQGTATNCHALSSATLTSGLNILPSRKKSDLSKTCSGSGKSVNKKSQPLEKRDLKYQVQDAMTAEGRNKQRVAFSSAAAVHQPRGRSGTVTLPRRPAVAGVPVADTSRQPPANLVPGQGYDNDIYSTVGKKRQARPPTQTQASDTPGISSTDASNTGRTQSIQEPKAANRPKLPLHVGGKIPRNVRQRILDTFFDGFVEKGMDPQEAKSKALSDEDGIFKRSSSRQLYNNMSAVKVGRLRAELKAAKSANASSPSEDSDPVLSSVHVGFGKSKRVGLPTSSSSASVTGNRKQAGNVATPGGLFSSGDRLAAARKAASNAAVSSAAGNRLPSPTAKRKSISALSVNPSLAAAVSELKAIHDKRVVVESKKKGTSSASHNTVTSSGVYKPVSKVQSIYISSSDDSDSAMLTHATSASVKTNLKRSVLTSAAGQQVQQGSLHCDNSTSSASHVMSVARKRKLPTNDDNDVLGSILAPSKKPRIGEVRIPKKQPAAEGTGNLRVTSKSRLAASSPGRTGPSPSSKSSSPGHASSPGKSAPSSSSKSSSPGHTKRTLDVEKRNSAQHLLTGLSSSATRKIPQAEELTEDMLVMHLKPYLATSKQLCDNGYPQPGTLPNEAILPHIEGRKKPHPPTILSSQEVRYICSRCGIPFVVKRNEAFNTETCTYHFGRAHKHRESGVLVSTYSCCSSEAGSTGCQVAECHVWDGQLPSEMPQSGYVTTKLMTSLSTSSLLSMPKCFSLFSTELLSSSRPKVLAFDCEMSYTTIGLCLTRITVIDYRLNVLMDSLVQPRAPVVDYNTRFSGITEKDLQGVSTRLEDIQEVLLQLISADTILVGHSLESDLKAIKMIHNHVVDTSLIFPHRLGPPFKKALKTLAAERLNKIIQEDDAGHNSAEDAIIAMELMLQKVKDDVRKAARKSSTVLVRK